MKVALFICLLAFMACEKDIIDIGKCIYKAPLVKELISDVIVAIATKDYSKLLPKIKESLPELIQIVLGCITDTKVIEDEKLSSLPFNLNLEDLEYIRCKMYHCVHLVLRLRGGGFAPQTLKVLYNNEFEKDVVINDYDEMDKTFEDFVLGLFKNWNINENIHNFDFYIGEDLINKKFKETLH